MSTPVRPATRAIMALFGMHVHRGVPGDEVPLTAAVALLGELGFTASAVRTALHRLRTDGIVAVRRSGRHAAYALTPRGVAALHAGARMVDVSPPTMPGDQWLMVASRVTDPRAARRLRDQLDTLNFATLVPGVRVHRIDWRDEIASFLANDAALHPGQAGTRVVSFTPDTDAVAFTAQLWDLDTLAERWRRWAIAHDELLLRRETEPQAAYLLVHRLTDAYTAVSFEDPQLPGELLPDAAHATSARRVFRAQVLRHYGAAHTYAAAVMADHALPGRVDAAAATAVVTDT